MPRIVLLLVAIAACWIASVGAVASAQPTEAPACPRDAERTLRAGRLPDLSGCRVGEATKLLDKYGYRYRSRSDESDGDARDARGDRVTRQIIEDGLVLLSVATRRRDQPATPEPPVRRACPDGRRVLTTEACPAPPPAQAMQTCPDGSRIAIAATCPDEEAPPPVITKPPVIPAATPTPAPPPPPLPPVAARPTPPKQTTKPSPTPAPSVDPCQQLMAVFIPPHFSIAAPPQVREGDRLTVTVHSDRKECRAHKVGLVVDRAELLAAQPPTIEFLPQSTEQSVTIATAKGQPGDGDQSLTISLRTGHDAAVGEPGSVTVRIIDTPKPDETPTYAISAPQNTPRGQVLTFEVRRSGSTGPARLEYAFRQGKDLISPDGLDHPLVFGTGETSKTLDLPGERYAKCGLAPTLVLRGPSGVETQASATFSTDRCTLLESLNEKAPWWPIPALVAAAVLGFGLWQLGKKIFSGPPTFYPKWELKTEPAAGEFNPPRLPDWPRFATHVDLEWGGASMPEPLPIAEKTDG